MQAYKQKVEIQVGEYAGINSHSFSGLFKLRKCAGILGDSVVTAHFNHLKTDLKLILIFKLKTQKISMDDITNCGTMKGWVVRKYYKKKKVQQNQ